MRFPRRRSRPAGGSPLGRAAGVAAALLLVAAIAGADTIEIRGMTFVSGDATGRHLVVHADRAEIDPRTEVASLHGVEVRVQDTAPTVDLTLRCETARIVLRDEGFRLDGDVRGVDAEGREFRTDWLEYDPVAESLRTTASVTIVDGDAEYRGGALVYDVGARHLRLLDGATVVRGAP